MIKIKNQINFLIILLFLVLANFLTSCGGGSKTVLPDAPPPYPDSPFVKEVQPGSFNQSTLGNTTGRDYYNRNRNVGSGGWNRSDTAANNKDKYTSKNSYTINAKATVWVLIQDNLGNELEWLSLEKGQSAPITHSGPLTITCSSGESLNIISPDGKPFQPAGMTKGISIIRIPK